MSWKQALVVVAVTLGMIAPLNAVAGSAGVSCVSKGKGFVTNSQPDGTFCQVDSETGGKSTAKASTRGQASADDFTFGKATSNASDGGTAEADAQYRKGKAKATATGDNSSAFAMGSQCPASAVAKSGGNATANCDTGKATADASDKAIADAESKFVTKCVVKASATGMGSSSTADCEVPGGFVTVTTTGGGVASGNGFDKPICIPHSGTATVKSSAGNCP